MAVPSVAERIREIEEELQRTPHNKASERHIGRLKARLAKLRREGARGRGGPSRPGLRKAGDATVALVGFPSVGKSTLLNRITEAESPVGEYDFTTLQAVPGLLNHEGARIQVLDLPGLTRGAAGGRGRGREVLSHVRIADLLLLLDDVTNPTLGPLLQELEAAGIRVNEDPPRLTLHPRDRGGIVLHATAPLSLDEETVRAVLREWGVVNAEVVLQEDLTVDRLIDALAGNRVFVPGMVVLTKADLLPKAAVAARRTALTGWITVPISAKEGWGLTDLLETIYRQLDLIRIYLRPPGGEVSREAPLVVRAGGTVEDVCHLLHGDLVKRFRHALVWGPSAKFAGQQVGLGHTLADGDALTLVTRAS